MGTEKIIIDAEVENEKVEEKIDFTNIDESNLIKVKTLPIIEYENVKIMGELVRNKIDSLNLENIEVTQDTIAEIKKTRAELRKLLNRFEETRIAIRREIEKPYNEFKEVYDEHVKDLLDKTDRELKDKITGFEDVLRDKKRNECKVYFEELKTAKGIEFVSFDQVGLNVTLSASEAALKRTMDEFISNIEKDLELINTHEYKNRLLAKYVRTLNFHSSLLELQRELEIENKALESLKEVPQEPEIEKEEKLEQIKVEANKVEPILQADFTVYGTREQIKAVRDFIVENKIKYEAK